MIWRWMRIWTTTFIIWLVSFGLAVQSVNAMDFQQVLIRPSRMATAQAPGRILIQASVSESVTEDGLQLNFGSAWSSSGLASNFTVSTSDLPAGVVSWPGIGTATAATSNSVTFPSQDLTAGQTYGFYMTGGIASNPGTSGSDATYIWQVATLVGGSPSSTASVVVPALMNDQVSITAEILPPASAFSADLTTSDNTITLPQSTEIVFTITYGSTHVTSSNVTLQAGWDLGTIQGNGVPSVELLDYVAGSASTAFGGATPTINLTSRTITWAISNLPANTTGQTVTFALRTSADYYGGAIVDGLVAARVLSPVSTVDSEVAVSYKYAPPAVDDSTDDDSESDTQASTSTSSPSLTSVPLTTTSNKLKFVSYNLSELTSTTARLVVITDPAAKVSAKFGTDSRRLNQQLQSLAEDSQHEFLLSNLQQGTTYFVRLNAVAGTQAITSELLTFTTAQTGAISSIQSVTLTSAGTHLLTATTTSPTELLFPGKLPLELTLHITEDQLLRSVLVDLRNDRHSQRLQLSKSQAGVWNGRLTQPLEIGRYELKVISEYATGAFTRAPLGLLVNSSAALTVLNTQTKEPIERARVLVLRFDPNSRLYSQLQAPSFLFDNPTLSNHFGEILVALPPGQYRLEVSAAGFQKVTHEFDTQTAASFPVLEMKPARFSALSAGLYHLETLQMKVARGLTIIQREAKSSATLQLLILVSLLLTLPLTVVSLLAQFHFSLRTLVWTMWQRHAYIFGSSTVKSTQVRGQIVTISGSGVPHASVTVFGNSDVVLAQLSARFNGAFEIGKALMVRAEKIMIVAPGYVPQSVMMATFQSEGAATLKIELEALPNRLSLTQFAKLSLHRFLTAVLDGLVLSSLLLSVCFYWLNPSLRSMIFIGISLGTLLIQLQAKVYHFMHAVHITRAKTPG